MTQEVDAVAELIKKLAKGKKVKIPTGCSYDQASKTLTCAVVHAEKLKALLAAATPSVYLIGTLIRMLKYRYV